MAPKRASAYGVGWDDLPEEVCTHTLWPVHLFCPAGQNGSPPRQSLRCLLVSMTATAATAAAEGNPSWR